MSLLNKLKKFNQNVVGINHRNLGFVYPNNKRKYFKLSDDKSVCKAHLKEYDIPTTVTYAIVKSLGEMKDKWEEVSKKHNCIAIKPAKGRGGGGILILQKLNDNEWQSPSGKMYNQELILNHIANIIFGVFSFGSDDKTILEYCIKNHEFFRNIYPIGIPDVRIISLKDKIILGMIRIPTDKSDGKGNLHQGALGVALDIKTGRIGQGFDGNKYISVHPDNEVKFEGLLVPQWDEIIAISKKTAKSLPLKYLGIDIVLDDNLGPLVIEVNVRPGLEIQNVNKIGLMEQLNNQQV